MKDRELNDIWTRVLDGQPLTANEEKALHAAICQRPELSRESEEADNLFSDWQIDVMLRTEIDLDTDQFVNRFVERLALADTAAEPLAGNLDVDDKIKPPPVIRPPVVPPPVTVPARVHQEFQSPPVGLPMRRWSWVYAASAAALLVVMVTAAIVIAIQLAQPNNSNVARDTEPMKGADKEVNNLKVKPFTDAADRNRDQSQEKPRISEPDIAGKDNKLPPDDRTTLPLETVNADNGTKSENETKHADVTDDSPQTQSSVVIARLTASEAARWDNGYQPKTDLLQGSLSLVEGTVEITMGDGTVLEIAGPTTLELVAKDRVALQTGRLLAHVPKQAIGFTVQTPSSKIVDLGTEFIVDVAKDKSTSVQVTKGEVEVSSVKKTRKADEQTWRLQAGDYKWISTDGQMSFDWRLAVELGDPKKNSEIVIEQTSYDMSRPDRAVAAMVDINARLSVARQRLERLPRGKAFSGEILIDGKSNSFDTSRKFESVRQALMVELQKRWMGNMMNEFLPDGVLPKGFPRDFFENNGFNFFPK